jgi:hypothetical protein
VLLGRAVELEELSAMHKLERCFEIGKRTDQNRKKQFDCLKRLLQ